ncbi:MAG: SpoVR family protein [Caldilineaceae bacterium]|nr:SpoVR family protein [Caldilineaceae bacterium]
MDRTFGALPRDLQAMMEEIVQYAQDVGLDFPEVRFIMLDFDQMNKVAAYDGFPSRYPHWRFGMEYERLRKSYAWGLHRIYEMVINTDPCYAYLLTSNLPIDQKLVMAHVYGHADFFKNNFWFAHTNRRMLDETANHGARIRRYIERYGLEPVETFVDRCLSLENLIDLHSTGIRRQPSRMVETAGNQSAELGRLPSKGYMENYINPPEYLDSVRRQNEAERQQERNFPAHPQRDVLLFLLEHAPLEAWQQDVLAIIREEAYYFAPQRQTKIMNEGWACAVGDTLVSTNLGLLRLDEIVENRLPVRVSDGVREQQVYDWAKFADRATVRMTTRRGFVLEGSITHRIRLQNGDWRRLDELQLGDTVAVAPAIHQWPTELHSLTWQPIRRMTLQDVAMDVGVNLSTVIRYREKTHVSRHAAVLEPVLAAYEKERTTLSFQQNNRIDLPLPTHITADFAAFLGYLIGDGHISRTNREVGLTTADEEQAERFMQLGSALFGLMPARKRDGNRWRVRFYSQTLIDLLVHLGLPTGVAAREKQVPAVILQSPKVVVSAFLRAYFDCDGYVGKQGVILSTFSECLSRMTQLLLLQFGILSRRRQQHDGGWHLHIAGQSAHCFAEEIGFGLTRKQAALNAYLQDRQWFKAESWVDEVAMLEPSQATVYDLSVEETHCYAANGLINHNSYWHSHIMTRFALKDSELIDYADHHSGTLATSPGRLNPYKVGIELFRHIEDRWNRGAFGPDYAACEDLRERALWNTNAGLGRQKIFEVRRIFNDIGFIETFLTPEFAAEQRLFTFAYNTQQNNYAIASREFEDVKRQLLFNLTNFGDPMIEVVNANHQNRGELYLVHHWDTIDLRVDYAEATLENLQAIWGRPVHLETVMGEKGKAVFAYDGNKHTRKLLQHS